MILQESVHYCLYQLRERLFPNGCAICGEALLSAKDAYNGICPNCRDSFIDMIKNEARCQICGKPLITERDFCLSCRDKKQFSDQIVKMRSIFPYTGKFKMILAEYKFRKTIALGNFFVFCLNSVLDGILITLEKPEELADAAWVPVPPRPGKIKKQGWDQIDFLAGRLEKEYGRSRERHSDIRNSNVEACLLPVRRCLERLPSRSQKELNREERGKNLKGRIICVKPPPKTAILFDDVITTGATLDECAKALLEGGAERVYAVCLFFD